MKLTNFKNTNTFLEMLGKASDSEEAAFRFYLSIKNVDLYLPLAVTSLKMYREAWRYLAEHNKNFDDNKYVYTVDIKNKIITRRNKGGEKEPMAHCALKEIADRLKDQCWIDDPPHGFKIFSRGKSIALCKDYQQALTAPMQEKIRIMKEALEYIANGQIISSIEHLAWVARKSLTEAEEI